MKNFIEEWSKVISEAKNMLQEKKFESYCDLMEKANSIYGAYKKDESLRYNCVNFGMANYIFEDALPKLFKENKKAVKEFISTIKEDKNLMMQFNFYKALEKYNNTLDAKDYINESVNLALKGINIKTIRESNKKLGRIISKYDIKPSEKINEDKLSLFENCDYLLTHTKKLININEHNSKTNYVIDYTKKNYNNLVSENKINLASLVEDFNKKYLPLLNEEEKSFVQEIMDFKAPQNEAKKEKLFNKFKNECIDTVDKLISEASDEEKASLKAIKEQISNKNFCAETIVTDLAKLLEIRDVLMSE